MTATVKESRTEPAPVSLAEEWAVSLSGLTARGKAYVHSRRSGGIRISPMELHTLIELAESYLAVRDLDALPASEIPNRPIGEYRHALDRLYAAAKGVRP